jgi:hypothetical protein
MSGRAAGRGQGNRGGRDGNNRGRSRGRGRGNNYSGTSSATSKHIGLCSALGNHVFDYGQKGAAGQMRTTWEKIVHHVGTIYWHAISNELQNRKPVTILEPTYTQQVLDKHAIKETRHQVQQARIHTARTLQLIQLQAAVVLATYPEAPILLALLENNIEEATYNATLPLPIELEEDEYTQHNNEWRTYRERKSRLEKQRGQAFSMIRGQCMQVLLDKMKHDTDWNLASVSLDPLTLFKLIEKTVIAQTEDQYPYATVYEQECTLYSFNQNTLTNEQWYGRFNTRIDVGGAIGVTRPYQVLLEHVASEESPPILFAAMPSAQQTATREKAEERYLSYVFLRQSGKQHNKLNVDLQNDFTTGDHRYPKNRQATLHLLDKYSKSIVVSPTSTSKGSLFAQRGGTGRGASRSSPDYDKTYWRDEDCYNCNKKGHPSSHCPDKLAAKDSDDKSVSTRNSKSSKSSKSSITKAQKKLKKSFATLSTKIQEVENEDSDLSDSSAESGEHASHFQQFQLMQTRTAQVHVQQDFEQRNIDIMFKQIRKGPKIDFVLQNIIMLDS